MCAVKRQSVDFLIQRRIVLEVDLGLTRSGYCSGRCGRSRAAGDALKRGVCLLHAAERGRDRLLRAAQRIHAKLARGLTQCIGLGLRLSLIHI